MKRRLFPLLALLLAASLSLCAFAAGDQSDPLISLSYIENTFIPQVRAFFASSGSGSSAESGETGLKTLLVSEGGSIELSQGQQIILLSGRARIQLKSGGVINASLGVEAGNGSLNTFQRYILCEDSAAAVSISQDARLTVSQDAAVTQGDGRVSPFEDVKRGDWFFDDVISAYEKGLISGMSRNSFQPGGSLTWAQCIKLAACMHQLCSTGSVSLQNGQPWYESYISYALENGIIAQRPDSCDGEISRRDFVMIFYRALPGGSYSAINDIPDGWIPDVPTDSPGAYEIYVFYRAGISTGYEDGSFAPGSGINRAEVAAIMNRMMSPEARRTISAALP